MTERNPEKIDLENFKLFTFSLKFSIMALRLKKYFRVVGIIWLNQPPSCLGESQGFFCVTEPSIF